MTLFGKIINENGIQFAPKNYRKANGETVVNFNLSPELMAQEGFKPVSLVPPPVNEGEEEITYSPVYSDVGDRIEQNWVVVEIPEEEDGGDE